MGVMEFDFGVAGFSEYDGDDFLGITPDHVGLDGKAGSPPAAVCTPYGFLSRPLDPTVDANGNITAGCGLLWWRNGDQLNAIPLDDPRVVSKLPHIKKGESMQYASPGQFIRLDLDAAITLFTTADGTPSGQSVYFQVAKDAFRFVAPWGQLTIDATGLHYVDSSGARLDLGGIGGIPLVGSYAVMSAGTCTMSGAVCGSGSSGGGTPLALGTPLVQVLTQLITIVGALTGAPADAATVKPALALLPQLQTILAEATSS